ncbi:MAG: sulfate adenylyltransferase, partial [Candidatus Methylomirabilales bacterium]
GGRLINRLIAPEEREEARRRSRELKQVRLNRRQISDLDLIGIGALSPLEGFMGQADYERVTEDMRLASGLPWSMPVTLAVCEVEAAQLREGEEIALVDEQGGVRGVLDLQEKYAYDKRQEAEDVYRTTDDAHPGVRALYAQGDVLLAGPIRLLERPRYTAYDPYDLTPQETRQAFADRGWRTIVGFQTRNPVHRAHEYIQKCALEVVDGLLLHPLVGETKEDDIPAETRLRCYQVLLDGYYPKDRVILSVLPAAMRYAGPREAIFHALIRKNYGCTHFVVGRDHAGVGKYYGTFDAHVIFREFAPDELGISPLFFDHAFYCRRCQSMATTKTCPHGPEERVTLSGTRVREMLQRIELPPPEYSRREVAEILLQWANTDQYRI